MEVEVLKYSNHCGFYIDFSSKIVHLVPSMSRIKNNFLHYSTCNLKKNLFRQISYSRNY